jgi:glutaredoxin
MNLSGLTPYAIQATLGAVLLASAAVAPAQTVYRIVGADGHVTFSDKAPVNAEQGKVSATGLGAAAAASAAALPFELRQVAGRYPVVLYSAPDCGPCGAGRALLISRGIPFAERSVTSNEDIAALKRLSGETSLPFLSLGGQRIKGYSDVEWSQYLDAAGYPKTSLLPASYRPAAAVPLVALDKPAVAKTEDRPEARPEPLTPAAPAPANPSGIQF